MPFFVPEVHLDAMWGSIGFTLILAIFNTIATFHHDFLERERQSKLRISEERFRLLFESSPTAMWEGDFTQIKDFIDTLRITGLQDIRSHFKAHPADTRKCAELAKLININQATLVLFRQENNRDISGSLINLFEGTGSESFTELICGLSEGKTLVREETAREIQPGRQVYLEVNAALAPGSELSCERVLVSITDITHRVKGEQAIRENERRYRALFERTNDAVFLLGFAPQMRNRLFEPFSTSKDVGKDTGLGLWMSWSIVNQRHGGAIWEENTQESGARFIVELPTV